MTQPAPPQQLPADQVIEALTAVHADIQGKLAAELAQVRVAARMLEQQVQTQNEELTYLRSLQPADPAAS